MKCINALLGGVFLLTSSFHPPLQVPARTACDVPTAFHAVIKNASSPSSHEEQMTWEIVQVFLQCQRNVLVSQDAKFKRTLMLYTGSCKEVIKKTAIHVNLNF